jgi:protocatechuate 3,4-dioxygenase beta subunit
MRFVMCYLILAWLLGAIVQAQTKTPPQAEPKATSSISGRVTIAGEPASNALLLLRPAGTIRTEMKVVTDAEGQYQFAGLKAGQYTIAALAPAYVGPDDEHYGQLGKTVVLAEGESIEGVDFALKRGGVVTGRVTDASGEPVVAELLTVTRLGEGGKKQSFSFPINSMLLTDDRGVYRAYGLPAGRYLIGLGEGKGSNWARSSFERGYYQFTYHPDAIEEASARIVEVSAGSEVTNVDIRLGRVVRIHEASGRIINAETGEPIPYAGYRYNRKADEMTPIGVGAGSFTADAAGEFHIAALRPGRYTAMATPDSAGEGYSDSVSFEIKDQDVSGLEIKVRRAGSISGVVVIEGGSDPAWQRKLPGLEIVSSLSSPEASAPSFSTTRVSADGSFQIKGLRAGKAKLLLNPYSKDFSLARVERDGVNQGEGIEISAGEQITGVRLVVAYFGSGNLRGQVRLEGGTLPAGARIIITARRPGDDGAAYPYRVEVDSQGRFVFEGLRASVYEIVAAVMTAQGQLAGNFKAAPQNVTVADGSESSITLVIELKSEAKERER